MRRVTLLLAIVVGCALSVLTVHVGLARTSAPSDGFLPPLPLLSTTTTTTAPAPPPSPSPPQAQPFEVAHAAVSSVPLYDAPGGMAYHSLPNPTHEGFPLALAVREHRSDGWLRVSVPMRPNGSQAWVSMSDVYIRQVPNMVVVDLASRQLVVLEGGTYREVFRAPVAVGTDSTPTPTGEFYIDGTQDLEGGGAYGSRILSVAGFSEVYESFGSGNGQIAIHGTNQPGYIGQPVSNGCVRMYDSDVDTLASLAPVGTPVSIR
jgi:lipoprotein-anchoring transpeptidase ErfK/SrfK